MSEARAVARTMIQRAAKQKLNITNLKLQKLLYFAHGLMLVRHDRPLIDEAFQAWKYGPVLEGLYHDLKVFGPSPISPADGFIPQWPDMPLEKKEELETIDAVLAQLGPLSGGELINFSHDPNGPWNAVFQSNEKSIAISDDKIKQYFATIVKQAPQPQPQEV
ncbi:MAG: DUF4065 domain-containing protein [Polaromonas sp.]|nr:DUF4065 domain-containing protein [Polaromonas sp.]